MLATLALLTAAPAMPAAIQVAPCQQHRDQDRAFRAMREGRILPLPQIERRVLPLMRGARYLGPELDEETFVYKLKFLDANNDLIWVAVDGRTGQIIGRSN